MGAIVAGGTFIIIHSPFGRRSGAHFNPALTVAYFSLGRIHRWDAFGYVMAHFFGGIAGVFFAHQLLGANLSDFPVRYVITLPGRNGSIIALIAEFITSFVLMEVVLLATNHRRLARYTPLFVALVTVFYYMLSMSISGYSVNPARSFSSALFAHVWQGIWIYFVAPGFGMLAAATLYGKVAGADRVYCAKVLHDFQSNCPFNCRIAELYDRAQPVNQCCPETASPPAHIPHQRKGCDAVTAGGNPGKRHNRSDSNWSMVRSATTPSESR
jgi:aquaporin Z